VIIWVLLMPIQKTMVWICEEPLYVQRSQTKLAIMVFSSSFVLIQIELPSLWCSQKQQGLEDTAEKSSSGNTS